MVSSVIDGIAGAIYGKFSNTYEIYTERVEQGFTPPCFFIECSPTIERYRDRLSKVTANCTIQFYANSNATAYTVLPNLMKALETITVDSDKIHGRNITSNLADNIVTVGVTYSYRSLDSKVGTNMATLDISQEVEG